MWQQSSDLVVGNRGYSDENTDARRYGLSWTFQSSEYRNDPILSDGSAWFVFVGYEECRFHPRLHSLSSSSGQPAHTQGTSFRPPEQEKEGLLQIRTAISRGQVSGCFHYQGIEKFNAAAHRRKLDLDSYMGFWGFSSVWSVSSTPN